MDLVERNVIEHVDEDEAFLRTLVDENLVAGGHAVVSVPAWPSLFSSHDTRLRHRRRYTPRRASSVVRGAGLELVFLAMLTLDGTVSRRGGSTR